MNNSFLDALVVRDFFREGNGCSSITTEQLLSARRILMEDCIYKVGDKVIIDGKEMVVSKVNPMEFSKPKNIPVTVKIAKRYINPRIFMRKIPGNWEAWCDNELLFKRWQIDWRSGVASKFWGNGFA